MLRTIGLAVCIACSLLVWNAQAQSAPKPGTPKAKIAKAAPTPPTAANPEEDEKATLDLGESFHSLGKADAPLTLVEFSDYQCSFCSRFHKETFPQLKTDYIDTGKLRFISMDSPRESHTNAGAAAEAAHCAGDQGRFWEMRDVLINNRKALAGENIRQYAADLKLDGGAFQACVASGKFKPEIKKEADAAEALDVDGTPTFLLGQGDRVIDGALVVGALPYAEFQSRIDKGLRAVKQ